jgi:exodeoxyribonuclease X
MKILILDCETTGVSSSDQIIELAYVELLPLPEFRSSSTPYKQGTFFNERYFPSVPIHSKALEVHGITFKELLGKRKSDEVELPKDVTMLIGHNIQFDHRFLGKPEVKLICTLDLSRKMSKFLELDFPNHQLETLVQVLSPENTLPTQKYHSAKNDILKNVIVLQKLLEKLPNISSWEELHEFQQSMKTKPKKEKK